MLCVIFQPNSKSDAQGNSKPHASSHSSPNSEPSLISPCPVKAGLQLPLLLVSASEPACGSFCPIFRLVSILKSFEWHPYA